MKKITVLLISILSLLIFSCSSGPSDEEVLESIKFSQDNYYIIKTDILQKGKSHKLENRKVYSYTVYTHYILEGLLYGYISVCPERHCYKDYEYEKISQYLIGKNEWNEWKIVESRCLTTKEIQEIWRPKSISLEDFYGNFYKNGFKSEILPK